MGISLGIDLGTTDCCTCAVQDRAAVVLPSAAGAPTTPSVVAFGRSGEILVGAAARRQAAYNPEGTLTGVKRLLGRKFHSPAVTWLRETCPYETVPARNGDAWVRVQGQDYSPPEILAYLLEHLKARAEEVLAAEVDDAVIAVPAYFGERQRHALTDAARLAGLPLAGLLNDTTAAAIAHGFDRRDTQRLAVLDLGAGSFDVTIVEYGHGVFQVLAHAGDTMLGGDDLDRAIVEHLLDAFQRAERIDLSDDPTALLRLFEAARTAKHELSFATRATTIELPAIANRGGEPLLLRHTGMSRDMLEALVAPELDRMSEPCGWALEDIGLGTDDMGQVLLVGGMARMPVVQRRVEFLFRQAPHHPPGAQEIVARGAALYAAAQQGQLPGTEVREVTAHSVGIKVRGGAFSAVINRNVEIPCRERKVFAPAKSEQRSVVLEVYQGESELVRDNTYLGRFLVQDLEPNAPIVTAFALDSSGLLSVSTIDAQTGRQQRIDMMRSGGLSPTQVSRIAEQRARRHASVPPPSQRVVEAGDVSGSAETVVAGREGRRSVRPPPPAARRPRAAKESAASDAAIPMGADSLVGTTLGGRYLVEDIVAEGGMGRVYRARHKVLDKTFAIKVLHAELAADADLADRFVNEARAASAIRSDHVVDISDFGHLDDGTAYFVMEYLVGITLAELILDRAPLPIPLIADVGQQLANGLEAAHAMDIVHRDLKPENVTLIERSQARYFCKILDFGIAKRPTSDTQRRLTLAGELLGTPYYMAPEQIDGEEVDHRCDIYSLGAVLYEMATGRPPYDADSLMQVLLMHKESDPPTIERAADDQARAALEAIVHRCLAKAPEQRFPSASALAAELGQLV
ncbi:MAG: Hsp70 family protein [Deltaproteobacteria bacterium]|nr:Hsp70 family protein [Deltaproteobacteria bacterium]MBW2537275.1 Hsp70 family protein [Deltaproteobacteria bacterium]